MFNLPARWKLREPMTPNPAAAADDPACVMPAHGIGRLRAAAPWSLPTLTALVATAMVLAGLGIGRPGARELVHRAWASMQHGHLTEAILWAERAVALEPHNREARIVLLEAGAALGREETVARQLEVLAPTGHAGYAPAHLLAARLRLADGSDTSTDALIEVGKHLTLAREAAIGSTGARAVAIRDEIVALGAIIDTRTARDLRESDGGRPAEWISSITAALGTAPADLGLTDELIAGFHHWRGLPGFVEKLQARLHAQGPAGAAGLLDGIEASLRGRDDEACAHFRNAHARLPVNPVIANNLAATLGTRASGADPAAALAVIEPVLARHPRQPAFLDTRGRILLRLDRNTEAVEVFTEVLRLCPAADAHLALAEAFTRLGDTARAEHHRRAASGAR